MKKVLIITYYWPPSGGAGVQRWVKFAKYLSAMGVDPYVLTVHPDYATYPQTDTTLESDIPDGVKVYRTRSFELYSVYQRISSNKETPYGGFANTKKTNFKEKLIRFIRGNFFLPDPRRGWNKYAFKKAQELIIKNNIKTVITTSPPHSTQLIGLRLRKKLQIKWIADLRDPWTDIYYYKKLYPTSLATLINKNFEKKVLKNADALITVSDGVKELFSKNNENIEKKFEIIQNGFDVDDFAKINLTPQKKEKFCISYTGTLSADYNISGLIQALNLLPDDIKSLIKIQFVGKIAPELLDKIHKAGLMNNIHVFGYVSHLKAIDIMVNSDALLLIIPEVKNNKGIVTGKLFEYLASKKPVLCIGPTNGDAAKIIAETGSGQTCKYDDYNSIKTNLIRMFKQKNGDTVKSGKISMYSRENLTKKLIKLLDSD